MLTLNVKTTSRIGSNAETCILNASYWQEPFDPKISSWPHMFQTAALELLEFKIVDVTRVDRKNRHWFQLPRGTPDVTSSVNEAAASTSSHGPELERSLRLVGLCRGLYYPLFIGIYIGIAM